MSISTSAIVATWSVTLVLGVMAIFDPVPSMCQPDFPSHIVLFVLIMPFVVFGFAAIKAQTSPFLIPRLAASITAWTGNPSYETFLVRFKPMLFFGSSSILSGLSELRSCFLLEGSVGINAHGWFFVAGGAAFILMHIILKMRKVPGV